MHYLVTGGCGFIGSHFIQMALQRHPTLAVTNLDLLTYAGNPDNLRDIQSEHPQRYHFLHGDIADPALVDPLFAREKFDAVINFAAESMVDRSIASRS